MIPQETKGSANPTPRAPSQFLSPHDLLQLFQQILFSNELYTDSDFPPVLSSLVRTYDNSLLPNVWKSLAFKRLCKLMQETGSKYRIFDQNPNINQPKLESLWNHHYFLSALLILCQDPKLIKRLFLTDEINKAGAYCIWLCDSGIWRPTIVDDNLVYNDKSLAGVCTSETEIWASLLEKAYAKVHGSYESILSGGEIETLLRDLTGAPVTEIPHHRDCSMLWEAIKWSLDNYFLVSCESQSQNGTAGSVFSVLEVKKVEGIKGQERLLHMKSLAGNFVWKGNWSHDSPFWTPEMKKKLQYSDDPDYFWISIEDYDENFARTIVLHLKNENFYSSFDFVNTSQVALRFEISKQGEANFSLNQRDSRYFRPRIELDKTHEYRYSFARLLISKVQPDSSLAFIGGTAGSERNLQVPPLRLDPGRYIIYCEVHWAQSFYQHLNISSYSEEEVNFEKIEKADLEVVLNSIVYSILHSANPYQKIADYGSLGDSTIKKYFGLGPGLLYLYYSNKSETKKLVEKVTMAKENIEATFDTDQGSTVEVLPTQEELLIFKITSSSYKYEFNFDTKLAPAPKKKSSANSNKLEQYIDDPEDKAPLASAADYNNYVRNFDLSEPEPRQSSLKGHSRSRSSNRLGQSDSTIRLKRINNSADPDKKLGLDESDPSQSLEASSLLNSPFVGFENNRRMSSNHSSSWMSKPLLSVNENPLNTTLSISPSPNKKRNTSMTSSMNHGDASGLCKVLQKLVLKKAFEAILRKSKLAPYAWGLENVMKVYLENLQAAFYTLKPENPSKTTISSSKLPKLPALNLTKLSEIQNSPKIYLNSGQASNYKKRVIATKVTLNRLASVVGAKVQVNLKDAFKKISTAEPPSLSASQSQINPSRERNSSQNKIIKQKLDKMFNSSKRNIFTPKGSMLLLDDSLSPSRSLGSAANESSQDMRSSFQLKTHSASVEMTSPLAEDTVDRNLKFAFKSAEKVKEFDSTQGGQAKLLKLLIKNKMSKDKTDKYLLFGRSLSQVSRSITALMRRSTSLAMDKLRRFPGHKVIQNIRKEAMRKLTTKVDRRITRVIFKRKLDQWRKRTGYLLKTKLVLTNMSFIIQGRLRRLLWKWKTRSGALALPLVRESVHTRQVSMESDLALFLGYGEAIANGRNLPIKTILNAEKGLKNLSQLVLHRRKFIFSILLQMNQILMVKNLWCCGNVKQLMRIVQRLQRGFKRSAWALFVETKKVSKQRQSEKEQLRLYQSKIACSTLVSLFKNSQAKCFNFLREFSKLEEARDLDSLWLEQNMDVNGKKLQALDIVRKLTHGKMRAAISNLKLQTKDQSTENVVPDWKPALAALKSSLSSFNSRIMLSKSQAFVALRFKSLEALFNPAQARGFDILSANRKLAYLISRMIPMEKAILLTKTLHSFQVRYSEKLTLTSFSALKSYSFDKDIEIRAQKIAELESEADLAISAIKKAHAQELKNAETLIQKAEEKAAKAVENENGKLAMLETKISEIEQLQKKSFAAMDFAQSQSLKKLALLPSLRPVGSTDLHKAFSLLKEYNLVQKCWELNQIQHSLDEIIKKHQEVNEQLSNRLMEMPQTDDTRVLSRNLTMNMPSSQAEGHLLKQSNFPTHSQNPTAEKIGDSSMHNEVTASGVNSGKFSGTQTPQKVLEDPKYKVSDPLLLSGRSKASLNTSLLLAQLKNQKSSSDQKEKLKELVNELATFLNEDESQLDNENTKSNSRPRTISNTSMDVIEPNKGNDLPSEPTLVRNDARKALASNNPQQSFDTVAQRPSSKLAEGKDMGAIAGLSTVNSGIGMTARQQLISSGDALFTNEDIIGKIDLSYLWTQREGQTVKAVQKDSLSERSDNANLSLRLSIFLNSLQNFLLLYRIKLTNIGWQQLIVNQHYVAFNSHSKFLRLIAILKKISLLSMAKAFATWKTDLSVCKAGWLISKKLIKIQKAERNELIQEITNALKDSNNSSSEQIIKFITTLPNPNSSQNPNFNQNPNSQRESHKRMSSSSNLNLPYHRQMNSLNSFGSMNSIGKAFGIIKSQALPRTSEKESHHTSHNYAHAEPIQTPIRDSNSLFASPTNSVNLQFHFDSPDRSIPGISMGKSPETSSMLTGFLRTNIPDPRSDEAALGYDPRVNMHSSQADPSNTNYRLENFVQPRQRDKVFSSFGLQAQHNEEHFREQDSQRQVSSAMISPKGRKLIDFPQNAQENYTREKATNTSYIVFPHPDERPYSERKPLIDTYNKTKPVVGLRKNDTHNLENLKHYLERSFNVGNTQNSARFPHEMYPTSSVFTQGRSLLGSPGQQTINLSDVSMARKLLSERKDLTLNGFSLEKALNSMSPEAASQTLAEPEQLTSGVYYQNYQNRGTSHKQSQSMSSQPSQSSNAHSQNLRSNTSHSENPYSGVSSFQNSFIMPPPRDRPQGKYHAITERDTLEEVTHETQEMLNDMPEARARETKSHREAVTGAIRISDPVGSQRQSNIGASSTTSQSSRSRESQGNKSQRNFRKSGLTVETSSKAIIDKIKQKYRTTHGPRSLKNANLTGTMTANTTVDSDNTMKRNLREIKQLTTDLRNFLDSSPLFGEEKQLSGQTSERRTQMKSGSGQSPPLQNYREAHLKK